jgi:hypothetical protein
VENITLASIGWSFARLAAYFVCGALPANVPEEWRNQAWVASILAAAGLWIVRRIFVAAKAKVVPL